MFSSVLVACGKSEHKCGYCKSKKGSKSVGNWVISMTCSDYETFMNHGFRRSGKYLYKPLMETCCPQYTIRMPLDEFYPSKQLKRAINKLNTKFLIENIPCVAELKRRNGKVIKTPNSADKDLGRKVLFDALYFVPQSCLDSQVGSNRKLIYNLEYELFRSNEINVHLCPSQFDADTFELYCKYQSRVHNDFDKSRDEFTNFLVDHPFESEPMPAEIKNLQFRNCGFGFYHLKIYIKDSLKAVSFIDILPSNISSVYCIFENEGYEWGKIAACYEIYVGQQLSLQIPTIKYYYLGYYIESCIKMKYKSTYQPCYIMDPFNYTFVLLSNALPYIKNSSKYTNFAVTDSTQDNFRKNDVFVSHQGKLYSAPDLVETDKTQDVLASLKHLPDIKCLFLLN
eukprot:NODE_10_length_61504_cov_0.956502.p19 type:complete len:397 gc:universal NODE_10_length_61504_cov_0.956502:44486-45676(+)